MADHFGVGLALKFASFGNELVAERLEILDDAVVDERHGSDDMRMCIAHGRRAMRCPARMGYASGAVERARLQLAREILELALGPTPFEAPIVNRADSGGIITAVFEPLQPIEQALRDIRFTHDPDNAAHDSLTERPGPARRGIALESLYSW